MKISLLAILVLTAFAGVAFASIANANTHWNNWLEILSWLLFGVSFIAAFHTRSTIIAAYPIFFIVCKFILEDHENYLFGPLYSAFDLNEKYGVQLVLRHITQITFPMIALFLTAIYLWADDHRKAKLLTHDEDTS